MSLLFFPLLFSSGPKIIVLHLRMPVLTPHPFLLSIFVPLFYICRECKGELFMYTNIDRIRILRNKYYDYNKQFLSLHGDPEVVVRHDDDGYSLSPFL